MNVPFEPTVLLCSVEPRPGRDPPKGTHLDSLTDPDGVSESQCIPAAGDPSLLTEKGTHRSKHPEGWTLWGLLQREPRGTMELLEYVMNPWGSRGEVNDRLRRH